MDDAFLDGLAFAAIAQDDRDAAEACAGLSERIGASVTARLGELAAMDRTARRGEVRRMARRLAAVPADADLPPSAARLLVTDVPREVARTWEAAAPKVRRGFRVSAGLKRTLRRLAWSADPTAEPDERAAATRVDDEMPEHGEALRRWARGLADGADAERVLGALALGAQRVAGGDGVSRTWRRIGRDLAEVWSSRPARTGGRG